MAETSREDAISSLEAQRDYGIFTARRCAIDKAISDMKKLEKIEEVLEHRDEYALDILNAIKMIENIVKEQP